MRWLISLGLIGCTAEKILTELKDPNDNSGVEIEVEPRTLQFSSLTEGEQEVQSFTIRSVGVDPLEVNLLEVIGDQAPSFTILTMDPTFTLEPNEEQVVDVAFSPLDANQIYAEALIGSNAGNEEQALVSLQAEGIIGALDISPNPLNLGETMLAALSKMK